MRIRAGEQEKNMLTIRDYLVIKSNELIQSSRYQLSLQEQRIVLYLISKIKPEDIELKEYEFEIADFCRVCGIEPNGGSAYKHIKNVIKALRDKSMWIKKEDGAETTLAWIDKVTMIANSGKIIVKMDDDMKPYLLQLRKRFTQYELLYTLAMKSQYSIRLYEILKSYEWQGSVIFNIDELKNTMFAEKYTRFPDFKRYVLDIAMREINDLSDIFVSYEIIKEGRKYAKLSYIIETKEDVNEKMETLARIDEVLNPTQTSLFEKVELDVTTI